MMSFLLVVIEKNRTNFVLIVKDFLFSFLFAFFRYGNLARLFVLTLRYFRGRLGLSNGCRTTLGYLPYTKVY